MADPRIKQIRIKTGVVKRLSKEKVSYEREAHKEQEKLARMREAGEDAHLLRKQEEVINESMMMIPDTARRYQVAYNELKEMLDTETELAESEEYAAAREVLEQS